MESTNTSSEEVKRLISWNKRNFFLRIINLIILISLLSAIVYYKYGTPPNLEDHAIYKAIGNESIKVIDCRTALLYYAEKELMIIDRNRSREIYNGFNLTDLDLKWEKYLEGNNNTLS